MCGSHRFQSAPRGFAESKYYFRVRVTKINAKRRSGASSYEWRKTLASISDDVFY